MLVTFDRDRARARERRESEGSADGSNGSPLMMMMKTSVTKTVYLSERLKKKPVRMCTHCRR
jgi:hypothetical protein